MALVDVEIPGHERFEHHVVRVPQPAAGVVVHDPGRGVLLLWRHRFITDTWGWEIPAGRVEVGETIEEAAAREVLEETGWRPGPLEHLLTFHPANGITDLA
ncbi:MAG: NUDIX hydrolase, partial [Acidimicrobiales bacterium]|nr:NUDIX hydrolase [Acidimicrobiales bacterium]